MKKKCAEGEQIADLQYKPNIHLTRQHKKNKPTSNASQLIYLVYTL
ncbi:MAG: hypothetical protein SNG49_02625 [Rikenellaceae bacterium]